MTIEACPASNRLNVALEINKHEISIIPNDQQSGEQLIGATTCRYAGSLFKKKFVHMKNATFLSLVIFCHNNSEL
ncbi:MAG: hypothetical protein HC830_14345 [Bacteroidetes bacterium]|nr:hypothetical protein [Bacteroidota bacterium]